MKGGMSEGTGGGGLDSNLKNLEASWVFGTTAALHSENGATIATHAFEFAPPPARLPRMREDMHGMCKGL
jgi:hypothetical protein